MNIRELEFSQIEPYSQIPMSFLVKTQYTPQLLNNGLGGIILVEEQVEKPYIKDYDDSGSPLTWLNHFDVSTWSLWGCYEQEQLIGGATFVAHSKEIEMLGEREDLAVLWDIRIKPEYRRQRIGQKIFEKFEAWAREKNCAQLKIETQNINVAACKFYVKNGCTLGGINKYAYQQYPNEVMLLWYKNWH